MKNSMFVLLLVVSIVTSVAANDFTLRDDQFASISHLDADLDISVTDLNHDGLLDLFVVVEGNDECHVERWEQNSDGSAEFHRTANSFLSMSSHTMRIEFTDVDGDGLIDFFVGDYDLESGMFATIKRYEQVSANDDELELRNSFFNGITFYRNTYLAPVFYDLDNDGKLDLLIGLQNGTILHYEADSVNSANFSLITDSFNNIDIGEDVDLCIGDYNGDGLLDLVLGSFNHELIYYEQAQTGSYTFNHVNNSFLSTSMTPMKFSCFTDIDDDGYVDFLAGDQANETIPSRVHRYEIAAHVSTHDVTDITTSSAVVGVTTAGNSALTYSDCGICWSTSSSPTISDSVVSFGSEIGSFTTTLTDLDVHVTYHVRGYVQDQFGVSYGEEMTFSVIHDPMSYDGISCYQIEDPIYRNSQNQPILRIELETSGPHDPLTFYEFNGYTAGSTNSSHDIDLVKIFYTGTSPDFSDDYQFGNARIPNPYWEISEQMELMEGTNYFWVCCDVSSDAIEENVIDCQISYYWILHELYEAFPNGDPVGSREIISLDNISGFALNFDGFNDRVEIADSPELEMDDVFTISAWIYPDDLDSRYGIFSTRATNQAGSFQLEVGTANGGTNQIALCGVGTWIEASADNAIQPGEWNHIACTRSGSAQGDTKFYVNGVEVSSTSGPAYEVIDNNDPIQIASGLNGGQLFNGKIDEVRLWNVARTQQEIRESMHLASVGGYNELVANWQLNDGAGVTVEEQINSLNGTMINMTDEDWVVSDIPFGSGLTDTETEENGWVYFGATDLRMIYSSQSSAEVTVTRLDNAPNTLPSLADEAFDSQYWIVNHSDESTFNAELSVYVDEDISSNMAENPQMIKLFTRPIYSNGEWSYLQTASYAGASYDEVRFPNITQAGQFMVGVFDLPNLVSMDPQNNQINSHLGGIVKMEFNREMAAGTGNITLKKSSDDSIIGQIAASEAKIDGCMVVVDFNVQLDQNESYYVQIEPTAFIDVSYTFYFDGIEDNATWNFTTGTFEPDKGTCIEFDGVDDHINLGHSPILDLTEGITLECWVKPADLSDWARIFSAPGTFTGKYGLSISNVEGKVEACYRIDGGSSVYRKTFYPDICLDQWNHIAFSADDEGHGFLYINGVKAAAGANSSFSFTGDDLWIGGKQNGTYRFEGCLDEVRIWDYPRTQQQIADNMCTPIDPQSPGLKCYLLMNEGVGDLATDIIGGNDGTLSNMSRSGWLDSTIPYGEGSFQRIDIGEVGSYAFDQTGIDVDITSFMMMAEDTLEVHCTHLEEEPNVLPAGVDAVFDSQYWVIETWGDQQYQADITFHVGDEVTTADEAAPEIIALYKRNFGSDGDWIFHSRAIAASNAASTVTFTGISELSQFIIARNTNFPAPEGIPGNCLTFDGEDDYVELANEDAFDFTSQFTVECWFKPTSSEEFSYGGIFGKEWVLSFEADPTMTSFFFDGSFCDFAGYTDYENSYLDRWSHIAITYEFSAVTWISTLSMYLNGELVATADGWDLVPDSSKPFRIGTDGYEIPTYFEGEIDQVRLWSVCRTQEEIREHIYNPVSGLESGLTAIFQMNEGTGTTVADAINSMAGTLTNMDTSDWMTSTIPYGEGFSVSAVEASGIVDFNGTGITFNYASQSAADVTVSRIELAPDTFPNEPNTTFDDLYWVVNRYGTGDFNADFTFTLGNLTQDDQNNPNQIALFTRASTSDDVWLYLADASAVNAATGEATFDGLDDTGQFIITRWIRSIDSPQNLAIEVVGTDVQISWDDVDGANSYKIFACDTIDGTYVDVTESGSFGSITRATAAKKETGVTFKTGTMVTSNEIASASSMIDSKTVRRSRQTWSIPCGEEKRFFYITSSTEIVE